jgi:hypothetical protein
MNFKFESNGLVSITGDYLISNVSMFLKSYHVLTPMAS